MVRRCDGLWGPGSIGLIKNGWVWELEKLPEMKFGQWTQRVNKELKFLFSWFR